MPPLILPKPEDAAAQLAIENQALRSEVKVLTEQTKALTQQLDWFKRQLFGEKSEKRLNIDPQIQADLLASLGAETLEAVIDVSPDPAPKKRGKTQRRSTDVNDTGLRFSDDVPVTVIEIRPDLPAGAVLDDYEVIGCKITHRLCQNPGSYQILELRRPLLKAKTPNTHGEVILLQATPPAAVLDRSYADVSLLAGLLVDKFFYHLPLYRQHQRLSDSGVRLSRNTLMNWSKRTIELLEPIYDAQHQHILRSRVLAMDETPIKAGRQSKGKMHKGYFWPIYGEDDEVVFPYSPGRGKAQIDKHLAGWSGDTLLSDGYIAYERYVVNKDQLVHAQCWAHTRRGFEKAQAAEPQACAQALALIGELYRHEQVIRDQALEGAEKLAYRGEYSRAAFDAFWVWCETQLNPLALPSAALGKALKYAMARREALQVFLADPDVAIDTNHLERALRPIPMGRRNWLFCWSELGAKHVGIIQSLLVTCRLHGIHPYTYLVDVLQRISEHPAKRVEELTPRVWKTKFADNPLKSDLDRYVYNVSS